MTDNEKIKSEYVGTAEAAKILNLTQRRVNQAINEGRLEAVKIGNRWLIRRSSVYRYKSLA